MRASLTEVRGRLAGLDPHRQAIDARRLDLGQSLAWYSDTIETLIRVEDVAADEVDDRGVARDLERAALEVGDLPYPSFRRLLTDEVRLLA